MDFDWSRWPATGCNDSEFDLGLMLDAVYGASTTPPTTTTDLNVLHSICGPYSESQCRPYASDAQGTTTGELLADWLEGFASPPEVPLSPDSPPPPDGAVRAETVGSKWRHGTKLSANRNSDDVPEDIGEGCITCPVSSPSSDLLSDPVTSCRQHTRTPDGVEYYCATAVDVSDSPGSSNDSRMPSIRLRSSSAKGDTRTLVCHDSKSKPLKDQGCSRASHNLVERKYRNGLNDKFTELIAALGIANAHGDYCGLSSGRKVLSKGNVLSMASKQLQVLQVENCSLKNEVQRLGTLLYARQVASIM